MVHVVQSGKEFNDAIAKGVSVVDFYATWCGPCKMIAPKVVQFSEKYKNANYLKVDVDELPEVAQEYGIRAMPTFLIFKDGAQIDELVGANPAKLEEIIAKHAV